MARQAMGMEERAMLGMEGMVLVAMEVLLLLGMVDLLGLWESQCSWWLCQRPSRSCSRSPWTNQAPTGYGSSGYGGNTAYGAASSWGTSAGGAGGAAPTSQSPNSAYGNQGYGGYGGYGGADGAYASQGGGYGAVGGRGGGPTNNAASGSGVQGAGYMGGGYGDANGSSGYSNAWRSDPSQAAAYGSGQVNGPAGGPANYGGVMEAVKAGSLSSSNY
uniref:Uncharacterized protein n=1 Tax=Ananas comosus var. bracteatus TaxID=296719 RepID=A0A6V7PJ50_ANACO|nr:unnamed protein product [Ananas comosus var. bracteatus]